jgi:hypothetical protein
MVWQYLSPIPGEKNPLVEVTVNSKEEKSFCHNYVQEFSLRIYGMWGRGGFYYSKNTLAKPHSKVPTLYLEEGSIKTSMKMHVHEFSF